MISNYIKPDVHIPRGPAGGRAGGLGPLGRPPGAREDAPPTFDSCL